MAKSERVTLLEACVIRAGGKYRSIPKGSRVALFIAQWAWASADLDRPIIAAEYTRYWSEHERVTYRLLSQFRELFPEHRTPQGIAAGLAEAITEARRTPKGKPPKSRAQRLLVGEFRL